MRKSILIILALALLAGSASAQLGKLVASFKNVGTSTHYGLAADAGYLYSFYYYSTYRYPIIRMRRSNGAFVSSYPIPGSSTWYPQYSRGLSYDGTGNIYYNNYSRRYVARFRASNGSLLSTWGWPSGTRYGLCVDHKGTSAGTNIYQNYTTNTWWQSTLTGSLKRAWRAPVNNYSYDLAWDWNNKLIWCANYNDEYIYGVDPAKNCAVVAKFAFPVGPENPYGIAYWPNRLYVSNTSGSPDEWIWVFECPPTVGLTPASVGKIKALFE